MSSHFIIEATKDLQLLIPQIHLHPLVFTQATIGHCCDVCSETIRAAYRCTPCDFDLCISCANKKGKDGGMLNILNYC